MQHRLFKPSLLALAVISSACSLSPSDKETSDPAEGEWLELFNGQDLDDWTVKIKGFPAGENALNTFRLENGHLVINYSEYEDFNGEFGHIFYNKQPFSHYVLEVEYRFVGEQVEGGPEWAWRNNGIMYHAQAAEEMGLEQDFPTSMEYQLLGGDGETPRTTANLCTPATQVVIDGKLREDHCINSDSETYHGDQWVTAELEVHGAELAEHRIEGNLVMEYTDLQLDDGTPLEGGYIALQAESHPTEIRSVRLMNLEGCMDEEAKNYKAYLVKHDAEACRF